MKVKSDSDKSAYQIEKAFKAALKKHRIVIEHYGVSDDQLLNHYSNRDETI